MYLTRAFNDSKGPKKIRIYAEQNWSHDQIYKLFAVCAKAVRRRVSSFRKHRGLPPASIGKRARPRRWSAARRRRKWA